MPAPPPEPQLPWRPVTVWAAPVALSDRLVLYHVHVDTDEDGAALWVATRFDVPPPQARPASPAEAQKFVFEHHAHKLIGNYDTLPEAKAACTADFAAAEAGEPAPDDCPCEEISS